MKLKVMLLFLVMALVLSGCGSKKERKQITIAVLGSSSSYSRFFKEGIEKAYEDVLREYKDKDFDINIGFYDDKDDYEYASKLTSKLVKDNNVTAIIGSSKQEICENQAYQANLYGKICLIPHWFNDEKLKESYYDKTFYLNYSCDDVGKIMNDVVKNNNDKKWAVCYSENEVSQREIKRLKKNSGDIVDFVKVNTIETDFNDTIGRWKKLNVGGIVYIPYDDNGYELLYKIKAEMPDSIVVSDSSLDNNDELEKHRKEFNNVYFVDNFFIEDDTDNKYDMFEDTFEIHGYNTIRMIVDTAILNNTDDPKIIAEMLHKLGYNGVLEKFKFDKNGLVNWDYFSLNKVTEEDLEIFTIENK